MIDVHCHLEQEDFKEDIDSVIERCKNAGIRALISCAAHPKDFERAVEISKVYKGYVFITLSVHPIYVEELEIEEIKEALKRIRGLRESIVGIGETGYDFYWVKSEEKRRVQEDVFKMHIELALELDLPLIIHSRNASEKTVETIEEYKPEKVLWHFFGDRKLCDWIVKNSYLASFNTFLFKSKTHKKIVRDLPLENIVLETDSPWLGNGKRNEPISILKVAEKIAEIKKVTFDEVWNVCGQNAIKFFGLRL